MKTSKICLLVFISIFPILSFAGMLEKKEQAMESNVVFNNMTTEVQPEINTVAVSKEKKLEIRNLIERLKNNYRLYNKQELIQIQEKSKEILPESILERVDSKMEDSIKTYDDEILLDVIELLEIAIGESPSGVQM